jgi:hypothetical protein
MYVPFHLLKKLTSGILLYSLFLFHPPTQRETTMATTIHARIYAHGEVSFAKFLFLPSWFAELLEAIFSCFAKIIWPS